MARRRRASRRRDRERAASATIRARDCAARARPRAGGAVWCAYSYGVSFVSWVAVEILSNAYLRDAVN